MVSNLTQHYKYNMSETPGNPSELLAQSNQFMQGGFALGMLGMVWMVVLSSLLYRNHSYLSSLITANTVATFASYILFLMGFMGGELPLLITIMAVGTVFYSVLSRP